MMAQWRLSHRIPLPVPPPVLLDLLRDDREHVGPEHRVHPRLVSEAHAPEPLHQVRVERRRDLGPFAAHRHVAFQRLPIVRDQAALQLPVGDRLFTLMERDRQIGIGDTLFGGLFEAFVNERIPARSRGPFSA